MPETAGRTSDEWLPELTGIVGAERVAVERAAGKVSQYALQAPAKAFPGEERDVERLLGWANANRVRVAPQGGGTKDALGHPGDGVDLIVSLTRMSGILHHSVGDLMITALPGTTMREIQDTLAEQGQFLPLDPAWEERSTVGGVVAANASGPRRAMYGSARDHLIAARVVYPDGTLIRTGAKVVKNVAGYDMNKLLIGSMGTLGILTELTFKIRPIPAFTGAALVQAADPEQLRELQRRLLDSPLEPSAAEWFNGRLGSWVAGTALDGPALLVSFEDVERSVQYQLNRLNEMCDECGATMREQWRGRDAANALFRRMRERLPSAADVADEELAVAVKLLSSLSDVPAIYEHAQRSADARGLTLEFHGGLYTGIGRAVVRTDWGRRPDVAEWMSSLEAFIARLGGRTVVEIAPRDLRLRWNVWGAPSADWTLMKGIKHKIDPNRILNPGRFVGGM